MRTAGGFVRLVLKGNRISVLPDGLDVGGSVVASETRLRGFEGTVSIRRDLVLSGCRSWDMRDTEKEGVWIGRRIVGPDDGFFRWLHRRLISVSGPRREDDGVDPGNFLESLRPPG